MVENGPTEPEDELRSYSPEQLREARKFEAWRHFGRWLGPTFFCAGVALVLWMVVLIVRAAETKINVTITTTVALSAVFSLPALAAWKWERSKAKPRQAEMERLRNEKARLEGELAECHKSRRSLIQAQTKR